MIKLEMNCSKLTRNPSKTTLFLIIANEFCERYCFYAFRGLLFDFLKSVHGLSERNSTNIVHFFVFSCYLSTFIGGILSDIFLGRYNTILYLSIIYFMGSCIATLSSINTNLILFFIGLTLISIGTGGIKPCVSTFGGDQFEENDEKNINWFFSYFYFAINSGSLLSLIVSPIISQYKCNGTNECYQFAFGIPTVLLFISILLFIIGRNRFKKKPANKEIRKNIINFFKLLLESKNNLNVDSKSVNITVNDHKKQMVEDDLKETVKILKIFVYMPFFWMLYDQYSTTWIEQGTQMRRGINFFAYEFNIIPSQMQALNGFFILFLIPIFTGFVYRGINNLGFEFRCVMKMSFGLLFVSLAFITSTVLQFYIVDKPHILWQIPQYILLTIGEILLSMTGLNFVYTESPDSMKGFILSMWFFMVSMGNLLVVLYNSIDIFKMLKFKNTDFCNSIFYSFIGIIAACLLYRNAKVYKYRKI